jgi:hypothetical protein
LEGNENNGDQPNMAHEQTPTIHRTPGVDEDDGRPFIAVWVEFYGKTLGIRVMQDGDEPIAEERLVQAEAWVRSALRGRNLLARKGGAA